jgi:phosphonoacetaldehyde hydrolase
MRAPGGKERGNCMEIFIRTRAYSGPVQAVVLDWAGTSVDFGCMGPVAVFIEAFRRLGVEVTGAEARLPMGLMKKDHVRAMCRMPTVIARWEKVHRRPPEEKDVEAVYNYVQPLMTSTILRHAALIPGLLDAVAAWRAKGVKIGSCTGYTFAMMQPLLHEAKKRGYSPDSVVCPSHVPAGRPYPWMCYQNAINLEVYPLEAMVKIGDTVADIQEGLNAGMWTIGVTKTGNELGLTEAEVVGLDPTVLQTRLGSIEDRLRAAGAHYTVEGIWDCPAVVEEINERLARGDRP